MGGEREEAYRDLGDGDDEFRLLSGRNAWSEAVNGNIL